MSKTTIFRKEAESEKDFNELSSQYRNLEYRYTLLQQEKVTKTHSIS